MYAVAYRNKEFVALMIRRKANPYIKGHDGTGLYDLLSFSGDEAIAKMLEAYLLEKQ
jgi:ankyrin repeat protein